MNCNYCYNELQFSNYTSEYDFDYSYLCSTCHAIYFYGENNLRLLSLECIINNKTFRLIMDYMNNSSRIIIVPILINDTYIIVMEFKHILYDITHKNIENKIKTYMVFS